MAKAKDNDDGNVSNLAIEPNQIRSLIMASFCIELLLTLCLLRRQYSHIKSITSIPNIVNTLGKFIYNHEHFRIAKEYTLDALENIAVKKLYVTGLWMIAIHFNLIYFVWDVTKSMLFWPDILNPVVERNVYFTLICHSAVEILVLPLTIHQLRLEVKHGFYKWKESDFLSHYLKKIVTNLIPLGVASGVGTWALMGLSSKSETRQITMICFMASLYVILYPSFNLWCFIKTYEITRSDFEKSDLKRKLDELCDRVGFPKQNMHLLKISGATSSAFYFGFLWFHQIGVSSNLIEGHPNTELGKGLPPKQVEAIVAHELGHWNYNHSNKSILIWHAMQISTAVFAFWLRSKMVIYYGLGFPVQVPNSSSKLLQSEGATLVPGTLIAYYVVLRTYYYIFEIIYHLYQQKCEKEADSFAAHLGYDTDLAKGLIKLGVDQQKFPSTDKLYSVCYNNHPCLVERLHLLQNNFPRRDTLDKVK